MQLIDDSASVFDVRFIPSVLDDVAGCLEKPQAALSLDDITNAVRAGIRRDWHDRSE